MYAKSPRILQSANSYFWGSKCTSMISGVVWFFNGFHNYQTTQEWILFWEYQIMGGGGWGRTFKGHSSIIFKFWGIFDFSLTTPALCQVDFFQKWDTYLIKIFAVSIEFLTKNSNSYRFKYQRPSSCKDIRLKNRSTWQSFINDNKQSINLDLKTLCIMTSNFYW